eukprot:gb/GECH01013367.1/.p1 GENE.gb/GECH01013367.1/~~gb/GECH01013367.1/.p1  ORF type:complete len:305 (+),score=88.65 gb/GECH01013367.1/:1-915(+)
MKTIINSTTSISFSILTFLFLITNLNILNYSFAKDAFLIIDVQNCFMPPSGSLAVPHGDDIIPVINKIRDRHSKNFEAIILTQDWHCPNHVSFASQHKGKKPFDTIDLSYKTETSELCQKNENDDNDDQKNVSAYYHTAVPCSSKSSSDETFNLKQTLWPDHCVMNTEGAQFYPQLHVDYNHDIIFRKGYHCGLDSYSAFLNNDKKTSTGLGDKLRELDIDRVFIVGLAEDFCVYWSVMDAKVAEHIPQVYLIEDGTRGISEEGISGAIKDMKEHNVKIIQSKDLMEILENKCPIEDDPNFVNQ